MLDKTLRQILLMCRIVVPETPGFKETLEASDFGIRDVLAYVLRNAAKPVDYGRRYRKGQSISSAMAESAVNQVINTRMCKRQQMRWTPRGAHLSLTKTTKVSLLETLLSENSYFYGISARSAR